MGMENTIDLPAGAQADWAAVRDLLAARGFAVQLRMIDGQLAFPDEMPPANWTELRIGTPHGIITVRREVDRLRVVTWGNADPAMLQSWNTITWAFAHAAAGNVQTVNGSVTAEKFHSLLDRNW